MDWALWVLLQYQLCSYEAEIALLCFSLQEMQTVKLQKLKNLCFKCQLSTNIYHHHRIRIILEDSTIFYWFQYPPTINLQMLLLSDLNRTYKTISSLKWTLNFLIWIKEFQQKFCWVSIVYKICSGLQQLAIDGATSPLAYADGVFHERSV